MRKSIVLNKCKHMDMISKGSKLNFREIRFTINDAEITFSN